MPDFFLLLLETRQPCLPGKHVFNTTQLPPTDDQRCLCGLITWREGVERALLRAQVDSLQIGGQDVPVRLDKDLGEGEFYFVPPRPT